MSSDPAGRPGATADPLGSIRPVLLPAMAVVAVVIVVHAGAHVLHTGGGPLHVSTETVLLGLWALTTLSVVGGLAVLGRAYTALADRLRSGPPVDLAILPGDERDVLEPVIESPGITQLEVVDRSDYSDAKVSQTLTALRERGLVYREPQGRTYRLYPGARLSGP